MPLPFFRSEGRSGTFRACKSCDSGTPKRGVAGLAAVSPDVRHGEQGEDGDRDECDVVRPSGVIEERAHLAQQLAFCGLELLVTEDSLFSQIA